MIRHLTIAAVVMLFCLAGRAQPSPDSISITYWERVHTDSEERVHLHAFGMGIGGASYRLDERVLGCKKATTPRTESHCFYSAVPDSVRAEFFTGVVQDGILELKGDQGKFQEGLTIAATIGGHELAPIEISSVPAQGAPRKIVDRMFRLIRTLGLDGNCPEKVDLDAPRALRPELIRETVEGDDQPARAVTIEEVLSHLDEYNGKRVALVGYYRAEFECFALFPTDAPEYGPFIGRSLWVGEPSTFSPEIKMKPYFNRWVRMEGTVYGHRDGHLGSCPAGIQRITRIEPSNPPASESRSAGQAKP